MATAEQVERTVADLLARFEKVDPYYRALLPAQRVVEAVCTDLGITYHAFVRNGVVEGPYEGAAEQRTDIRLTCTSDDFVALAAGEISFSRAWASNRIGIEASMADLFLLRSVL